MIYALLDAYESLQVFLETGGLVLLLIGINIFGMWTLIFERVWFFQLRYGKDKTAALNQWHERSERQSWTAQQIRTATISVTREALNHRLSLIQTLIAICPLLGLLGTVTGMIEVFSSMSLFGTGNARNMAAGVSKATIPTMAGMVGALSGLFAITYLQRFAQRESELIEDGLTTEH